MLVSLEYVADTKPRIVNLHPASKRELKFLHLGPKEVERTKTDAIWCLTLEQHTGGNYMDHCYVWWSDLLRVIALGAPEWRKEVKAAFRNGMLS